MLKGAYEKEVTKLNSLTGTTPVGKINFTRCLVEARKSVKPQTVIASFRHTGTWPINRAKALRHPEIQADPPTKTAPAREHSDSEDTLTVTRQDILSLAGTDRTARAQAKRVANHVDEQAAQIAFLKRENASLRAQLEAATKTKKRRTIKPNPTARFQRIGDLVDGGNTIEDIEEEEERPRKRQKKQPAVVVEDESDSEEADSEPDGYEIPAEVRTRAGRATRPNPRYED